MLKNISELANMEKQKEYLAIQKQYAQTERDQKDLKKQLLTAEVDTAKENLQKIRQSLDNKRQRMNTAKEYLGQIMGKIPGSVEFGFKWLGEIAKKERTGDELTDEQYGIITKEAEKLDANLANKVAESQLKQKRSDIETIAKQSGPGFANLYDEYKRDPSKYVGIPMDDYAQMNLNAMEQEKGKTLRSSFPYMQTQSTREETPEGLRAKWLGGSVNPEEVLVQSGNVMSEIEKRQQKLRETLKRQ